MRGNDVEPPFLRAPDFPRVRRSTASLISGRASEPSLASTETLRRISAARVGGTFWCRAAKVGGGATLVRRGNTTFCAGSPLPADCDPWGTLAESAMLVSDEDDDWTIVAGLSGVVVVGQNGCRRSIQALETLASEAIGAWSYRDPFTGHAASIDATVDLLSLWRQTFDANRGISALAGIRRWKRDTIERFFFDGTQTARITTMATAIADAQATGGSIGYWPSRVTPAEVKAARAVGIPLITIEDGFVRSSGLGSNLTLPSSIAVDGSGIHYDHAAPSDLETLLENCDFTPVMIDRARMLIGRLLTTQIGKYGQQGASGRPPEPASGSTRRILVIGQVDDDESVRRGRGATVGSNRDLLSAVRGGAPDAHVAYRPHPDVIAGHRVGGLSKADTLTFADAISDRSNLFAAMADVDEVHVLTSLAGFEGLVRGHHIVVHGHPFYAGWGLTDDRADDFPRRNRRLTIEQLVAGALILYPRYIDPVTGLPCTVETVVTRLAEGKTRRTILSHLREAQGRIGNGIGRAVARVQ